MGNFTAVSTQNIPEDVYYFAQLTTTNLSGVVWVVAIISLTYTVLCSCVRFYLRRGIYGLDDGALLVAMLACIVQHIFIFIALRHGLGDSKYELIHGHEDNSINTYTRLVLFFIVHTLAKISLTLFTRRLFQGQSWFNAFACNVLLVMNCVFGGVSLALMSIRCDSSWYLGSESVCPNVINRWIAIKTLDVATELALIIMPIILICRILLNKKQKMIIVGTYCARLPVIAFTLIHFYELCKSMKSTTPRSVAVVWPMSWLQATLLWSMVTASLPSFKPLVTPFDTVMEESSRQSDPALSGAVLVMGAESKVNHFGGVATLDTVATSTTRLTQLEQVETSNWRPDLKGHTETVIEGPKRKLFRTRDREEDIELGAIYHDRQFEVSYEVVRKPSVWDRVWCGAASSYTEEGPAPAVVQKFDETPTPAPRRRSAYAFSDDPNKEAESESDSGSPSIAVGA